MYHDERSGTVQRYQRSDGVYRWFLNSGFRLRDPNGHIVRRCVLLTDIDERTRAEDALRAEQPCEWGCTAAVHPSSACSIPLDPASDGADVVRTA